MSDPNWRPRLSIEISEAQYMELRRLIPWGVKNKLFMVIIDDLITALNTSPNKVIGGILSQNISLTNKYMEDLNGND